MPPPLSLLRCLPHTSFIGFVVALNSNVLPCFGEIIYLFYAYNATTYIDHQTTVPSFWFRWFRPGFLITGMLYDVGMLAYCIYTEDIFVVLLAVRIIMGLYEVRDQLWLIKHWIPFFVEKEKRQYIFVRVCLIACVWNTVLCSTSWTGGSWQQRNEIFANIFYISLFVIIVGCSLWYLIQGGVDSLVKYRFHWTRNLFFFYAISEMILGIVGLIIGDGGENKLVETFNYHSAFLMMYFGVYCTVVVVMHYFIVNFEELSWKYPNPIILSSALGFSNNATTFAATSGILSASNRVACDVNVPSSSIEGARTGSIHEDTVDAVIPFRNHAEGALGDIESSNEVERLVEEDSKEGGNLEAAHGFVSPSVTVSVGDAPPSAISPPITASTQAGSILVSQQAQRRFALAFDGITRRSSVFRSNILTHHIMMVKIKRHELVSREFDKLCCILYQLILWETVMWLAQIFLTLYLQSVNAPTLPGSKGYYCQTPLENNINSAQFVNDFVFARR